jgi:hypothetical protein
LCYLLAILGITKSLLNAHGYHNLALTKTPKMHRPSENAQETRARIAFVCVLYNWNRVVGIK